FSLGCVLYEAATGTLPFDGPTIYAVINQIATTEPAPPSTFRPDLPSEFDGIVARAMAKNKDQRYWFPTELAAELQKLRASVLEAPAKRPLIAVLYFENLSREKEQEYFRDGMTEDII